MKAWFAAAVSAGILFLAAATAQQNTDPIRGFSSAHVAEEKNFEDKARALVDRGRIRAGLDRMAGQPHAAGSPASKAVAEYAAQELRAAGLDVKIEEFEALLPYPTVRELSMTAPVAFKASLVEPPMPEDKHSTDANQLPTYNSFAGSGDVTAPLVYVNYGVPADYEELQKAGVDVKGKIVIARYGQSWRGTKAKVAQEHGAVGCLIYSDPADDGYYQGDAFPKGPYRPSASAQRGSVVDMPIYPGDPLTPGWAGEKGARKLPREQAETILKIPSLPISWADARPLLENLNGAVVPLKWRGALPFTYHYGPGPATVHLKTDFDWTVKPVYNVIATIPGSDFPDEWVIYGNHHDAWVNGANDPVSGATVVLETGRVLGQMVKNGWKPRRTIKLALWDAEEFGLVGSTEWVEKHEAELLQKAVVYINSDSNSFGTIRSGGTPLLTAFFSEVLRDINDPKTGKPLLEPPQNKKTSVTTSRTSAPTEEASVIGGFDLSPLGAGSDYVAFYHHSGIASLNTGFSGPGASGVYHSIYDSIDWFTKFMDPDMKYGQALTQVMTTSLMRLADADLVPFDFQSITPMIAKAMEEVRNNASGKNLSFEPLMTELQALRKSSDAFENLYAKGNWQKGSKTQLANVNTIVYHSERFFAPSPGLEGRPWYRHRLAAPGLYTGYSAKTLPGIRENLDLGRSEVATREMAALIERVKAFRQQVDEATSRMNLIQ